MTVKLATDMKSSDIFNKAFAWLNLSKQNTPEGTWDISSFLNKFGVNRKYELVGLAQIEHSYLNGLYHYENRNFQQPGNISGSFQPVPHNVHAFTQVILHTLNSDSLKFHDMSEIPGMENQGWEQLSDFAHYLLKQGWIEVKNKEDKLYIKLTIKGNLYLRSHDTAA